MSPSRISAVPSVYRGPGRVSRRKPAASRVRASASVLLLETPRAAASSLSVWPSAGPSATMPTSRSARATLLTV